MYSFIVNPNSRSGEGRNVWNRLRSIMESQGISYQYFLTEYVGHATVLARRISAAGTPEDPVTLVTVGGDGTIYEVLTGIIDLSSVVFGFIPVGSGNDFCRSTFLHCKICTPRMRVCFPQRALGRQNSIFSLEIPSITITSSKPSSGLAFGQNLKPPPSYFWFITAANQVLLKVCGLFPSSVIVTGDGVRKRNCFSATIR